MITGAQIRDTERVFNIARKQHNMNAYETVLALALRAREIQRGALPRVPENGNKPTTIAIREVLE